MRLCVCVFATYRFFQNYLTKFDETLHASYALHEDDVRLKDEEQREQGATILSHFRSVLVLYPNITPPYVFLFVNIFNPNETALSEQEQDHPT